MALIRQAGTFTDRFGNDVAIATGDNADTFLGSGDAYIEIDDVRSISFTQLTVNGTVANANTINFDGATVAANALVGQYFLNGGEAYRITANTASSITIDSTISLANDDTLQVGGSIYAINRTIRVQSGGALRQHPTAGNSSLAGRHINFINCNIIFEAGSSLGPGTSVEAARAFSGHVSGGQAATTSINFIGCDATFEGATTTLQTVSTDWVDSNVRVTNQFIGFNFVFNRNPGSRTDNTLIETLATTVQEWNFYGNPEILSDVVLSGFRLRTGSGAGDQTVLAPNLLFGNLTPNNFYSFNSSSGANPGFHHPGFTYIASAVAPLALTSRTSSQFTGNTFVVNHYGYDPTFYDSGLLTADSLIQGARIRMTSNANIGPRSGTNVAGSIVASAKAQTTINEFLTNAQGRMVSNRFSGDGGNNFITGYFDYTQSLNVGTAGATSFGATQAGQSVADGVGIFPLQVWRAGTGFDTTNNVEVRSYSHDLNIDNDISISDYSTGDFIPIDTTNVVAPSLIGSRVKPANINADLESTSSSVTAGATTMNVSFSEANQAVALIYWGLTASNVSFSLNNVTYDGSITLTTTDGTTTGVFTISSGTLPTIAEDTVITFIGDNTSRFTTFTANSTVSLNDIGNALRALWANYEVNANQGTTLQTGNFDETTYPTRIHIRSAAETTGANTWQETWGGARVASAGSGGQIRIAVLGNGIAGKDDDLYASLPGARTYNFAGLPLSDVPLQAQERLARIGNVHNVTLQSGLDGAGPSGANDFYDIQFEDANRTITGLTTLSPGVNRAATQAVINLPTTIGDADSDITLTRGRIIQTFGSGATVGTEGIRDNSNWTNFSTTADVNTTVMPNITINGGTHAMVVSGHNTSDVVWDFSNVETISIDLPAALPTNLVRINTGGNADQRATLRTWLVSQVGEGNFSEATTADTAPTSGYWLVAPVAGTYDYDVTIPTTKAGWYAVRQTLDGTETEMTAPTAFAAGANVSFTASSSTYSLGDSFDIFIGYESAVGNGGDDAFYRRTQNIPFPATAGSITANEPITVGYPARNANAPNANETAVYDAASTSTVGLVNITNTTDDAGLDVSGDRAVGLALNVVNSLQYFSLWYTSAHTNDTTADGITIGDNNTVIWNTDIITFQSGDVVNASLPAQGGGPDVAAEVPVQHFVRGWSAAGTSTGAFSNARAGVAEVNGSVAGSASLVQVQEASAAGSTSLVTKIDDVLENQTEVANAYNENPLLADAGRAIDLPNKIES